MTPLATRYRSDLWGHDARQRARAEARASRIAELGQRIARTCSTIMVSKCRKCRRFTLFNGRCEICGRRLEALS